MSNDIVVQKKDLIGQIGSKLQGMIAEQSGAFPKDFNETRFLQNCLTVLADTKDIEKCKPMSVVRTMIKGAYLGLDFFRRECYAIPYGEVLTFQTDYKGEIKLAKMYGKNVVDVYAKVVQEGDELDISIKDGRPTLDFKPKNFNDGKVIGVFAVVIFKDGSMKYDTMSVNDVEDVRKKFSKSANGPGWTKAWNEMAKKTVLRRLCKLIDLNFNNQEQERAWEEGSDAEIHRVKAEAPKAVVSDPFADEEKTETPSVDAEIVQPDKDHDPIIWNELKRKFPQEETWQLEVRYKEMKGES